MISHAFRQNAMQQRTHAVVFFEGDGRTDRARLLDRRGAPLPPRRGQIVQEVHQTDWQGRTLLYATPRTNYCPHSNDLSRWDAHGELVVNERVGMAPDGQHDDVTRVVSLAGDLTASLHREVVIPWVEAGELVYFGLHVKPHQGSGRVALTFKGAAFPNQAYGLFDLVKKGLKAHRAFSFNPRQVARQWLFLRVGAIATHAGPVGFSVVTGGEEANSIDLWGACIGKEQGGYLPTEAEPRTVTDWMQDDNEIVFGHTPSEGALYDWSGIAFR